jgi:hypothetical protein
VTVSGGDLAGYDGTVALSFAGGQNITDSAGNSLTNTTPTGTNNASYTLDNTLPTLTSATIASNNSDTTKAKVGDIITLTFTASETISTPTVTIGGHTITPTNTAGNTWSATYTLLSTDTEGNLGFTVDFADSTGNTGTQVTTATSGGSTVAFDKTVPTLSSVTIASNNTDTTKAKTGDTITITINASESITPTVTIAGQNATIANPSGNTYTATYTMTGAETEGTVAINIAYVDGASNSGTTATTTTNSSTVTYDKTLPTASTLSPADDGTNVATTSDFTITFSENVTRGSGNILLRASSLGFSTMETIPLTDTTRVSISGNIVTINPTMDLSTSTTYSIQVASTAFTDASGNAYAGISDDTTWNFVSSAVVSAPQITAVATAGSVDNSTKVTATAGAGNTLAYKVSSSSITTPAVGDTPAGVTAYTSTNDITSVDRDTNKYVGIYELDSNGDVVKFKLITLTKTEINMPSAPTLTATASAGTANRSTKVTATAGAGNTLAYKVSTTTVTTPDVGDVPVGTTAYTSANDITTVDATTNKYLAMYELDTNGEVVKFKLITITNSELNVTQAPLLTATATPGSVDNTTKVTATAGAGNTLAYKVSTTSISTPLVGDTPTGTTSYTSGADITGVDRDTNKYLGIYELDGSGNVVKFKQFTLTKTEINMPSADTLSVVASAGSTSGTTKLTVVPTSGNTISYKISTSTIATPDKGDVPTATAYTLNSDISGVDATTNKYLGVYELDTNGEVVKFKLLTITASQLATSNTNTGGSTTTTYTVDDSFAALDWDTIRGSNTFQQNVTTNLNLISSDSYGSTITWTSSDTNVATTSGAITQPTSDNEKTIVLKATLTKDGSNRYKYFFITVPKAGLSDTTKVEYELSNISFEDIRLNNLFTTQIVSDVNLSSSAIYGTTLSWSSSDTSVIATNGVVTRGNSDTNVTLTVTSTLNSATDTKNFNLIVKATPATDADAVAKDKSQISPLKILGQNRDVDHIIYNLSLPSSGENGSTISWSSSNTSIISNTGVVSRDSTTDKSITLTATITKNSASDTLVFKLKVLADDTTELINAKTTDATFQNLTQNVSGSDKVITAVFSENSNTKNNIITVATTHQIAVETDNDAVKTTINVDTTTTSSKVNALTAYQNANGTSEVKVQFENDDDGETNLATIASLVTDSSTSVDSSGNVEVSATSNSNTLKAKATSSGTVSHVLTRNGVSSQASTTIKNSSVNIKNDGSVETDSTVTIGGYIFRAVAVTDSNNETITKFIKTNVATGVEETLDPTLNTSSKYQEGANVTIYESNGQVIIQTEAPLSGSIVIE